MLHTRQTRLLFLKDKVSRNVEQHLLRNRRERRHRRSRRWTFIVVVGERRRPFEPFAVVCRIEAEVHAPQRSLRHDLAIFAVDAKWQGCVKIKHGVATPATDDNVRLTFKYRWTCDAHARTIVHCRFARREAAFQLRFHGTCHISLFPRASAVPCARPVFACARCKCACDAPSPVNAVCRVIFVLVAVHAWRRPCHRHAMIGWCVRLRRLPWLRIERHAWIWCADARFVEGARSALLLGQHKAFGVTLHALHSAVVVRKLGVDLLCGCNPFLRLICDCLRFGGVVGVGVLLLILNLVFFVLAVDAPQKAFCVKV
mmetsp:Transcript_14445/g.36193  ORF Transcript_14445/g.36193 Transcript_14445/m.36193 type:complete len:314 (-) Transcript_14445:639-1580(-)